MMNETVQILITGDTHLGSGRVKGLALLNETEKLFGPFLDDIQNADIAITNLESPLTESSEPLHKTGPNLKSPPHTAKVLKSAGFNLLTLANNHIMDFKEEGLKSTIKTISDIGINTVGTGKDQKEAKYPFIFEIKGRRIAFINIAENEFSTTNDDSFGAHGLDPIQNYYSIVEASEKTDFTFVIVHGGHENYSLPSPRMKATYRFFVDAGASAVIGHHTHCYSGYEMYNGAPVFYSLGNYLFDRGPSTPADWHKGFMVNFELKNQKLEFNTIPYIQNAQKAGLRKLNTEELSEFEDDLAKLNRIIADDKELNQKFEAFVDSSHNLYSSYIEPHSLRYLHALRNRNLFPSMLSDRKKRLLSNLIRCESHRDVLLKILEP